MFLTHVNLLVLGAQHLNAYHSQINDILTNSYFSCQNTETKYFEPIVHCLFWCRSLSIHGSIKAKFGDKITKFMLCSMWALMNINMSFFLAHSLMGNQSETFRGLKYITVAITTCLCPIRTSLAQYCCRTIRLSSMCWTKSSLKVKQLQSLSNY